MSRLLRNAPVWIRRERLLDFLYIFSDAGATLLAYMMTIDSRFGSVWIRRQLDRFPGIDLNLQKQWIWGGRIYDLPQLSIIAAIALVFYLVYAYLNLYHGYRMLRRPRARWKIFCVNIAMLSASFMALHLAKNNSVPRSILPVFFLLNTTLTILFRHGLWCIMRFARRHTHRLDSPALIIGKTPHARDIANYMRRRRPHGNYVAAHVASGVVRDIDALRAKLVEMHIRTVVIADTEMSLDNVMNVIELTAELHNISCTVVTNRLNVIPLKAGIPCSMIRGVPCIYFDALHSVFKDSLLRRAVSRVAAAAAIIVISPLLLGVAVLVRATSPGPALFRQKRYGINRRTFTMFKFRTMYVDAEKRLAELESKNEMGRGGLFKIARDPRVTVVGHTLRRFSVDELPQLFNVLRGEMRFVGPRPLPERDFNNYYRDWHYGRHLGTPGLTCLWQVSGRSDIDFPSMCILDLYYIRNNSWALDLSILFRTVAVVLNGKGAY